MTEFREQDLTHARFERVSLRGATFTEVYLNDVQMRDVDLTGLQLRGALLNGCRMRGVELVDVDIHGELQNVVVNGVDIAPLVDAELNRRMPERALMRPDDSDGFREAWAILERLWEGTVTRARTMPEDTLHPQRRRRVVVHPDPAPPQLRQRCLGGTDGPRERLAVAPAGLALGRGARVGRHPVGPGGASVARRRA
jgi:hypothetical protein